MFCFVDVEFIHFHKRLKNKLLLNRDIETAEIYLFLGIISCLGVIFVPEDRINIPLL